jgi:hypothetical protein
MAPATVAQAKRDSIPWLTPPVSGSPRNTPQPSGDKLWISSIRLEDQMPTEKVEMLDLKKSLANGKDKNDLFSSVKRTGEKNVGTACPLFQLEDTTVSGQFSGGFSNNYEGLKNGQEIPEFVFGFQVQHELDKRNKLLGIVEFGHDVMETTRSRVRTQAAWEVLLDQQKNVSLRTGVEKNTQKSTSGEQMKNVDCSVDLIWKF